MRRRRVALALACAALSTSSCSESVREGAGPASPEAPGEAGHAAHVHPEAPATDAPSAHSIYHLRQTWTSQREEEVALSSLGGRVQVLAMVYTHCEAACPRILADMRRIRSRLQAGETERVGFVLVSIDPARDTPERLARFARQSDLDEAGWLLLRADDAMVRELAAVLGVRYRRVSETDFTHSNLVSVIDTEGVVVHRQVGLGVDPDETVAVVRALLAD